VWLDDLNVTQAVDGNAKNFGSVRAAGHSGSDKFAQVANFLEDLETSAFIDDFEKPSPPEGTQTLVDETLVPPVAWAFPLSLSLKAPEERAKAEAARLLKTPENPAAEGESGAPGTKTPGAATPAQSNPANAGSGGTPPPPTPGESKPRTEEPR
jgi:hypothetical protein